MSKKGISSVKADIVIREFRKEQPSIGKSHKQGLLVSTQLHTIENQYIKA
ncbi:MAG: hypothetical protein ACP5NQ_09950 [Vulcanisaeta sp.]